MVNTKELKGGNIVAVLKKLPGECSVKIGCADGSGYFYIGSVARFQSSYGDEFIAQIESELKHQAERRLELSLQRLNEVEQRNITVRGYITNMQKHKLAYNYDGYENHLRGHFAAIEKLKRRVSENEKALAERTPFAERKIVMAYPSTVDENTYSLLIEGEESGIYWFKEEYENQRCEDEVIDE